MHTLLDAKKWFSLNETIEYLNIHFPNNAHQIQKLSDFFEEGALTPYIRLKGYRFLKITSSKPWSERHLLRDFVTDEKKSVIRDMSNKWLSEATFVEGDGYFCLNLPESGMTALEDLVWRVDLKREYYKEMAGRLATSIELTEITDQVDFNQECTPIVHLDNTPQVYLPVSKQKLTAYSCSYISLLESIRVQSQSVKDLISQAKSPAPLDIYSHEGRKAMSARISPLMKIANDVWETHYANLAPDADQPKKDFLILWMMEKYQHLSKNQAESIYNVTRRDPPFMRG